MPDPFAAPQFESDKVQQGLMEEYKSILAPLVYQPVTLLEIGIFKGGSIKYWDKYLKHPASRVVGLDLALPQIDVSKRVSLHVCDQNDRNELRRIGELYQPFDLVIDDGSHQTRETRTCFEMLYPFVKPGGYYVIEDWAVGYFAEHFTNFAGMVEFITELVQRHPSLGFEATRIVCETGKSMAFFQKRGPA